ncbi:hypothetical protein G6F61_013867 [Rhizopus arrhizus]|nr:hypothetical protein G6F61_013867 [Rhizopus arrhizus]
MARHLASVYDGHLLPSVRPPAPPDPSSLGLPFGPPGSSPLVVSPGAAAHALTSTTHSTHFNTSIFSPATLALLIGQLPTRKAPGTDHIKAEMLKPISTDLSFLLSWFFSLCWQWSYVPSLWRHAQYSASYLSCRCLHGCPLSLLLLTSLKVVSVLVGLLLIKPYVFMN